MYEYSVQGSFPQHLYYTIFEDRIEDLQLSINKNIINCLDRCLKIVFSHSDDDIQLTGSLIDHFYVDMRMCQRRKDSSGSTACLAHTASHNCNQCKIRFQFNIIRIHGTVDACNDHRIAMAAAVAAGGCRGNVVVRGSECVNKSYPDFWRDLDGLKGAEA